jgi:hypothetical protein
VRSRRCIVPRESSRGENGILPGDDEEAPGVRAV